MAVDSGQRWKHSQTSSTESDIRKTFKMNFIECKICGRKCSTCIALDLHMNKVHKETEEQKIKRKQVIIIQEVEKKKKNVTPVLETEKKEEQLVNEQNWEDLEDSEESEGEEDSKLYAIKYYLNSNGEQMGLTFKGKAKAHIESHNKSIEIMDKQPKTKEKYSTFGKSKFKVIEKPPKTPTLLTLKLQVTAPDNSVGTAELKLHKPAKKGATLEIRKTSDGDFDTVEKLKDAIVKLFIC